MRQCFCPQCRRVTDHIAPDGLYWERGDWLADATFEPDASTVWCCDEICPNWVQPRSRR